MSKTLWIIAAYFLFQAVLGALSRQAKKKQQQARRERTGRPEPTVGGPLDRPLDSQDTPREEPVQRQTPEDIAAEIRRVMGLERAESSVEVIEEVYEPPVASSAFASDVEPDAEPSRGGDLRARLMAKDLEDHNLGSLARRHPLGSLSSRFAGSGLGEREVRGSARHRRPLDSRGSAYLDLSDIARALVTADILGPPKALRDDF
jgi:hypothetical protein